jgi:hypothetical protein
VLLLERYIRPLLLLHGVAAAVLVGASTHHLLWCRGYLRGRFGRYKAERRFALIVSAAFLTTFCLGNLLYPTYKVRVRAEYFDNAAAYAEKVRLDRQQDEAVGAPRPPPGRLGAGLGHVARLFDIKEHWVALGVAASLLLLWLSRRAHPRERAEVAPLYVGLSAAVCATAWAGALIGLYTASHRTLGG